MSTHASIIVKTKDGIYQGCYLHFDGYPAHVGHILPTDFGTTAKAEQLAKMTMIESIKVGGFIQPWEDQRDVGDPVFAASVEEISKRHGTLHVYVFENGEWFYDQVPLTPHFRREDDWAYRGRRIKDATMHDFNVRYHNQKRHK